jgi:hypothetical protein
MCIAARARGIYEVALVVILLKNCDQKRLCLGDKELTEQIQMGYCGWYVLKALHVAAFDA